MRFQVGDRVLLEDCKTARELWPKYLNNIATIVAKRYGDVYSLEFDRPQDGVKTETWDLSRFIEAPDGLERILDKI